MIDYKICWVIEALLVLGCLNSLYGRKLKVNIYSVSFIIADIVLMQIIKDGIIPKYMEFIVYVLLVTYCRVNFKDATVKSIFVNMCLTIVFLSCIEIICTMIVVYIVNGRISEETTALLIYISMSAAYLIIVRKIPLKKISDTMQRPDVVLAIILLTGTVVVMVCIVMTKVFHGMQFGEYIFSIISITALLVMSVSWYNYKMKATEAAAELHAYKLYEESFKNLLSEIRIKQHDFNNHISAVYNQHKVYDTYDELVKHQKLYCDDIVNDNKYTALLKAGDSAIIGFLYGKFIEAEKKGITIKYDIHIMTLDINVPVFKIIEILGNFINNAIDELEENAIKILYVEIYESNEKFVMRVGNTGKYISPEQFTMFFKKGFSRKNSDRGIGLYGVKKVCDNYGFDIICSDEQKEGNNVIVFEIRINKAVI